MTKQELIERLETLEKKSFFLGMKDRWNSKDYNDNMEMAYEIARIKKELEKLG